MSWAISVPIRNLIVKSRNSGMKMADVAKVFCVAVSTVVKLMRRYKETGSVEPIKPKNGRPSLLSEEQLAQVKKMIEQQPDITLQELKDTLSLPNCISGLSRIIRYKLKFTFKKKLCIHPDKREKTCRRGVKRGRKCNHSLMATA